MPVHTSDLKVSSSFLMFDVQVAEGVAPSLKPVRSIYSRLFFFIYLREKKKEQTKYRAAPRISQFPMLLLCLMIVEEERKPN